LRSNGLRKAFTFALVEGVGFRATPVQLGRAGFKAPSGPEKGSGATPGKKSHLPRNATSPGLPRASERPLPPTRKPARGG
jgi:hypothetical protein